MYPPHPPLSTGVYGCFQLPWTKTSSYATVHDQFNLATFHTFHAPSHNLFHFLTLLQSIIYTPILLHTWSKLTTGHACKVKSPSVLYRYRGTVQSLCSWSATTCTTWTLLEHQALTLRTLRALGSPLVPDPDQVSKHASLIPRPRVWLSWQGDNGKYYLLESYSGFWILESGISH